MIRFSADWVLPISDPPIGGGAVTIDDGRIVAVGRRQGAEDVALGRVAVLPGLVNAHTHLELSYLHGRIPRAARFLDWVRPMLAARDERTREDDPAIRGAAEKAIQSARAAGTSLIGDVTNTLATVSLLRDAGMPALVFHELIGFAGINVDEQVAEARRALDGCPSGEFLKLSLAAHAPYSVSPALFAAVRRDLEAHGPAISTVHLGESPEEVELLESGEGAWRTLLQDLGAWNREWEAPRCSPVNYLADMGFLDSSVLAVHGVQFDGYRPGPPAVARRNARVVSPEQPPRRRGFTAARGLLCNEGQCGIRHGQPGERG